VTTQVSVQAMVQGLVKGALSALLLTAFSAGAVLAQGSAQAGQGKVATCAACHGASGNDSLLPNVPKLGGQGERYLLKQLQDIKADIRKVPLMAGQLTALSDQDLADIAAYFASLDRPVGATEESKLALGRELYRAGNANIGAAACTACHQPDGKGLAAAGYPSLTGQDTGYVEQQLKSFRARERMNDDAEVMRSIAERLSDAEIAAVASYVSGLR